MSIGSARVPHRRGDAAGGAALDEDRLPVLVASGQATEKADPVDVVELAARACSAALDQVPRLRPAVQRLSVVGTLSPSGPGLAGALNRRLGLTAGTCETTVIGGNTPQALVNRAAADIASGALDVTLITGVEVMRSVAAGYSSPPAETLAGQDPVYGTERMGVGPAETAAGLFLPLHIYAMFESAIAHRLGHSDPQAHRRHLGQVLAPFAAVAARHPHAWFGDAPSAEEISTPGDDNRLVSEPYTKRMCAFLKVDQSAALVVCSLAAARAAGVADRAVFIWSGASCNDVWEPVARPDLACSPGIAAAAGATLSAAGIGIDDVDHLDLYACFPSAVQAAASALGVGLRDSRGLTVTGGLPYFGGPGNNYSTHAIATMAQTIRDHGTGRGLVGALGWYTTKHSYGLYGASPPPRGYHPGDTAGAQARIDGTARTVAAGDEPGHGTIAAATVCYSGAAPTSAPAFIDLDDGRRFAANATEPQLPVLTGSSLVGRRVRLVPGRHRYEITD